MQLRHVFAVARSQWLATQSGKRFEAALGFAATGILRVPRGQVSIITRLHLAALIFLNVVSTQNPFTTEGGQAIFDAAARVLIAPRSAGVINAHWLIGFYAAIEKFRGMQRDFAERYSKFRMQFSRHVNLGRVWKLVGALWPD